MRSDSDNMSMIYLDNSATTPLSDAAKNKITETLEIFGNPSSLHSEGQRARALLDTARAQLLSALGVRSRDAKFVFTSCGTEATALALYGTAYAKKRRDANLILTTDSEHSATEKVLQRLEADGFEVVRLSTKGGDLDMEELEAALDKKVFLATFMLVNNETGAIYPVKEAFLRIKRRYPDAITHTDAIQAFMKIPFTPQGIGADLVSVSGHKLHAPKGVGGLYIAPELIKAKKIIPFLDGGGQEMGLRSGTENVIGISAFGAAVADIASRRAETMQRLCELKEYALQRISELDVKVNMPERPADHIMSITLPNIKSETMLHKLSGDGIFVSSGSACSSHSRSVSHTLLAFGLSESDADCTLRVSFSEYNTKNDIDELYKALDDGLKNLVRIKR